MAGLKSIAPLKAVKPLATTAIPVPAKAPTPTKYEGRPPVDPNKPVIRARNLASLGLGVARKHTGGPGLAPPGFEGTQPEWVWYVASANLFNDPLEPRMPPYGGATKGDWAFTDPIGVTHALRQVGGTTPDFVYLLAQGVIIVRINGFYWHTAADPAQQARDAYIETHAQNDGTRVESVEDSEFMDDASGAKATALLAEILGGRSFIGAVRGGIAVPPRYADFTGTG